MSRGLLDFSKWKKTAEDGDCCTMEHPSGHSMTILTSKLDPIQKEAIKRLKLADGGAVDKKGTGAKAASPASLVDSGYGKKVVRKYENGGAVDQPTSDQPAEEGAKGGGHVTNVYVGSQPVSQASPTAAQARTELNNLEGQDAAGNSTAPVPVVQPAAPNASSMNANPTALVNQEQAANNAGAVAEGEFGNRKAAAESSYLADRAKQIDAQNQALAELTQHANDFRDYMQNNPTDPNHMLESMTTGRKVSTAIGLFLGGLGTAFGGGPNVAYDFLNKQIDRDIDAQKSRQSGTVWGAYKDLYGDNVIANNMARTASEDKLAHDVNMAAGQLATPTAQARANQLNAQIAISREQYLNNAWGRLNELKLGGGEREPANVGPPSSAGRPALGERDSSGVRQPGGFDDGAPEGAGRPSGTSSSPDHKPGPDDDHILSSDADKQYINLQYNPLYNGSGGRPSTYAAMGAQKEKAALSDKAIDTINNVFPKLASNTQGVSGYLHRKVQQVAGKIPYVGAAVGDAINTVVTDSPENRAYDSDYSQVVGAIRGALQGNIDSDLLEKTIRDNAPESEDTPELLQKKMAALKEFIVSHTKTDMLGPLVNKRRS